MKKIYIIIFALTMLLSPFSLIYAGAPVSDEISSAMEDQMDALNSTGGDSGKIFENVSLSTIVAKVINAFLSLLGTIFIVLTLLAGYNWMTAGGDESKIQKAKDTLQRAIIGLIVTVSAYSITYTIFKLL